MGRTQKSNLQHEFVYDVPVLVYAGLIYLLSSVSAFPEDLSLIAGSDKCAHFVEYFAFGFLICRAFSNARFAPVKQNAHFLTILFGISFGLSDEWHQSFVPGREATIGDAVFDALGIITATVIYNTAMKRIPFLKKFDETLERRLANER